jgi:dTDP-4-dehydrorhamnose 3,5-epimerase-like enzyme
MKIKIKGIKIFKSKKFFDNRGYFQVIYKKNKVNNNELIFD